MSNTRVLQPPRNLSPDLRLQSQIVDLSARLSVLERTSKAALLDFQRVQGNNSAYRVVATTPEQVKRSSSVNLTLTYTPPVDAWWMGHVHVGIINTVTATALTYLELRISPNDADGGVSDGYARNAQADSHDWRAVRRTYALEAGTTYTLSAYIHVTTGAVQYYQGPSYLWMEAYAFPRTP